MENTEIWKPVIGYEGNYEVSNLGRVRSLNYHLTGKTKVMKARKDKYGYLYIGLRKDGKRKDHKAHRLVWEAFNGPISAGLQINHLDENPANNWLDNLEVCTCQENINYGTRTERMAKALKKVMIGKNVNNPSFSKAVNQIDRLTGEVLNTYPSCKEAERQTGIHHQNIGQCCLNKPKHKTAGGFKWKYVND